MDEALIENAQHDIDDDERRQQQDRRAAGRALIGLRGTLERRLHGLRHADLALHAADRRDGVAERIAGREVEGDRDRRQLPLMVDAERHRPVGDLRHCGQRHQRPVLRGHIEPRQRRRVGLVLRQELEDHLIGVRRSVDLGDLLAAERRAQRGFDRRRRDPQRRGAVAIDIHVQRRRGKLQVGRDLREARRLGQRVHQLGGGLLQLLHVEVLQRVLVLRLRQTPADADHRRHLHEDVDAGDTRKLLLQDARLVLRRDRPLGKRLQAREDAPAVDAGARTAGTDGGHEAVDVGILRHDGGGLLLIADHLVEGRAVGRFGEAEHLTLVAGGQEVLRHEHEDADRGADAAEEHEEDDEAMPQAPAQ